MYTLCAILINWALEIVDKKIQPWGPLPQKQPKRYFSVNIRNSIKAEIRKQLKIILPKT